MQNKIILAALAGITATLATPAQAKTFDGPYIGVQAGWNRAETPRDALVIGGYAGYNHKIADHFVAGVEAGFSGTVDDKLRAQSGGNAITIDPRYSFDLGACGLSRL
jgi:outer membrane immunogenic protein